MTTTLIRHCACGNTWAQPEGECPVCGSSDYEIEVRVTCSVGQVGDRKWWCSPHRSNAEDCEPPISVSSSAPDGGTEPTATCERDGHESGLAQLGEAVARPALAPTPTSTTGR